MEIRRYPITNHYRFPKCYIAVPRGRTRKKEEIILSTMVGEITAASFEITRKEACQTILKLRAERRK